MIQQVFDKNLVSEAKPWIVKLFSHLEKGACPWIIHVVFTHPTSTEHLEWLHLAKTNPNILVDWNGKISRLKARHKNFVEKNKFQPQALISCLQTPHWIIESDIGLIDQDPDSKPSKKRRKFSLNPWITHKQSDIFISHHGISHNVHVVLIVPFQLGLLDFSGSKNAIYFHKVLKNGDLLSWAHDNFWGNEVDWGNTNVNKFEASS